MRRRENEHVPWKNLVLLSSVAVRPVYQCPQNVGFPIWFSVSCSPLPLSISWFIKQRLSVVCVKSWNLFLLFRWITYPSSLYIHTCSPYVPLCVSLYDPSVTVFFPPPTAHACHSTPCSHTHGRHGNGVYHRALMTLPDAHIYVTAMETLWPWFPWIHRHIQCVITHCTVWSLVMCGNTAACVCHRGVEVASLPGKRLDRETHSQTQSSCSTAHTLRLSVKRLRDNSPSRLQNNAKTNKRWQQKLETEKRKSVTSCGVWCQFRVCLFFFFLNLQVQIIECVESVSNQSAAYNSLLFQLVRGSNCTNVINRFVGQTWRFSSRQTIVKSRSVVSFRL